MTMGNEDIPRVGQESEPSTDEVLEPTLRPPSSGRMPRFDTSGIGKTAVVSFIVTLVVLLLMSFAGGMFFVTKQDFTTNMANMAITLDQAKAGLAQAQSDVTTAVQGVPTIVASQVNTAVSQATSGFNSQLSAVSDKATGVSNDLLSAIATLSAKDTELLTKIDALTQENAVLVSRLDAMQASMASYDARLRVLETTGVTTTSGGEVLSFGVSGDEIFYTDTANVSRVSVKITFTNVVSQDVEDILVDIPIYLDYYGATLTNATLSGQSGIGSWYIRSSQQHGLMVRNSGRFDVDVGDSEKVYLDFVLTFNAAISSGEIILDEDDIDLVDYDLGGTSVASSSYVNVDNTVRQYSIANGLLCYMPLTITNSNNSPVSVPVKLVLTIPSGTTVHSAVMSGTNHTVSISGSTVTFYVTAWVEANTTKAFSTVGVTLNYTGASPSTWIAVWSKQ